jgi:hypothetical protein
MLTQNQFLTALGITPSRRDATPPPVNGLAWMEEQLERRAALRNVFAALLEWSKRPTKPARRLIESRDHPPPQRPGFRPPEWRNGGWAHFPL